MAFRIAIWVLYFTGCAIVLGSWVNLVSPGIGWIGWVMGMTGWLLGMTPLARKESIDRQIQRLADLHAAGQLTDVEFEAAKAKVVKPGL